MGYCYSACVSGIAISCKPLQTVFPLCKDSNDEPLVQFSSEDLEDIGFSKISLFKFQPITIIDKAVRLINEKKNGKTFNINGISLEDQKTYSLLTDGDTLGVFKLETQNARKLLTKIKPACFEDLIALFGLDRPYMQSSGMDGFYAWYKEGKEKPYYVVPELEEIMKNTYGLLLYQEQMMQIAIYLADFSPEIADEFRRTLGNKKPNNLKDMRKKFIAGLKKNGILEKMAMKIFNVLEHFTAPAIPKSYATAYALISYQMAYLKANYPQEFMTALIFSNAQTYEEQEAGDAIKMKSPERAVKIINEYGNLNCKQ